MVKFKLASLALVGGIAAVGLSGCEQVEQAANEAVEKAKQTAVEAIDQARQTGSVDEARQSADNVLQDVKQQAAGFLDQASEYLRQGQPAETGAAEVEAETAPVE